MSSSRRRRHHPGVRPRPQSAKRARSSQDIEYSRAYQRILAQLRERAALHRGHRIRQRGPSAASQAVRRSPPSCADRRSRSLDHPPKVYFSHELEPTRRRQDPPGRRLLLAELAVGVGLPAMQTGRDRSCVFRQCTEPVKPAPYRRSQRRQLGTSATTLPTALPAASATCPSRINSSSRTRTPRRSCRRRESR